MPRIKSTPVKRFSHRFHRSNEEGGLDVDVGNANIFSHIDDDYESDQEKSFDVTQRRRNLLKTPPQKGVEDHDAHISWTAMRGDEGDLVLNDLQVKDSFICSSLEIELEGKWHLISERVVELNLEPNLTDLNGLGDIVTIFAATTTLLLKVSFNAHGEKKLYDDYFYIQSPTMNKDLIQSTIFALKSNTFRISLSLAEAYLGSDSITLSLRSYVRGDSKDITPSLLMWCLQPRIMDSTGNNRIVLDWYDDRISDTSSQFKPDLPTMLADLSRNIQTEPDLIHAVANQLKEFGVVTELRRYQLEGIIWMWSRLTQTNILPECRSSSNQIFTLSAQSANVNSVGWINVPTIESRSTILNQSTLYYNLVTNTFSTTSDLLNSTNEINKLPRSMILADEMGIGKSLQILSLILLMRNRSAALSKNTCETQDIVDVSSITEELQGLRKSKDANSNKRRRLSQNHSLCESASIIDSALPCFCGSSELTTSDLGWVQCVSCERWRHVRCAGFATSDEAESQQEFLCLACRSLYYYHHPIQAKTALIVLPSTLINQWKSEMRKHIPSNNLKTFVYKTLGSIKKKELLSYLSPDSLQNYDVIFMSFKTLKQCFHDANLDWENGVENDTRYERIPPQVLGLKFHLLVVDETQNIEGASESQILKMSCQLRAERKISVSGTPFGTESIKDLYNLAQFLDLPPFANNKYAWNTLIEKPQLPLTEHIRSKWLFSLFHNIFLRRTKAMVRDQLGMKIGYTLIRTLQFSSFEVTSLLMCCLIND